MADTIKSIKVSGGDYTDPQLWENDTDVSAGRWIGEIDDSNEYLDKNLNFSGGTGTPDADNFSWLRVTAGNKHSGVTGSGHARIRDTAGHVITMGRAFTVIEGVEIIIDSAGSSDECVRITADNFLTSRCIYRAAQETSQQDGLYLNTAPINVYADNCIFYNFDRAGIHSQNDSGVNTATWNVDSCSMYNCGLVVDLEEGGGIMLRDAGLNVANVFNNWAIGNDANLAEDYHTETDGGGNASWAGTDNIAGDASAEAKFTASFDSVVLIDTDPGSGENIHVDSISGRDFNITDEDTETVTQNGVDRSATHPAPQTTDGATKVQDLSTDINDVARTATWSIGAFEFVAAAAGGDEYISVEPQRIIRHSGRYV